jgi:hypothetical protein
MTNNPAYELRRSIENLVNSKLSDALSHRDGLSRLIAHRNSGVASTDIRSAERALEEVICRSLLPTGNSGNETVALDHIPGSSDGLCKIFLPASNSPVATPPQARASKPG